MPRRRKASERLSLFVAKDDVYWRMCKQLGDEGEAAVFRLFEQRSWPHHRFRVPDAISERKFATEEERRRFTTRFKNEAFLVDALAKIDGETCGVEVKTKKHELLIIDVADYDLLFELTSVIPVRIFFVVTSSGKIYSHKVRNPKLAPAFSTSQMRDEPVYSIARDELELVAELQS
jgi:hypothetical protein